MVWVSAQFHGSKTTSSANGAATTRQPHDEKSTRELHLTQQSERNPGKQLAQRDGLLPCRPEDHMIEGEESRLKKAGTRK